MKKKNLLIIIIVLFCLVVGGTLAFFLASASDSFNGSAGNIVVNYSNNGELTGTLSPAADKNEDISASVAVSLGNGGSNAKANIYINVTSIHSTLASEALVWEVYKNDLLFATGNFTSDADGNIATDGEKFYLVKNYPLTSTTDTFKVYVWLNGAEIENNDILNKSFIGKLRVEAITAAEFNS